jgi:hypothetical protein
MPVERHNAAGLGRHCRRQKRQPVWTDWRRCGRGDRGVAGLWLVNGGPSTNGSSVNVDLPEITARSRTIGRKCFPKTNFKLGLPSGPVRSRRLR